MQCPVCQSPVDGVRCAQCGAALEVRDWTVERVIASHAAGRVYQARDSSGSLVVLKELIATPGHLSNQVTRFQREVDVLRSLSHSAVPRFIDAFGDGDGHQRRYFLVCELIEGRTLLEWLDEGPFSSVEAEDVARDLLDVLHHIHGRSPPIIHRDIKPANLMMGPHGRLVLVDFGAARPIEKTDTSKKSFIGTLGYAPPDQIAGAFDRTTDLYAVGATLIHLLTGRPPGQMYTSELELDFKRHLRAPTWAPFLKKLVARLPKDRFQTAKDAMLALNGMIRGGVVSARH